MLTNNFWPQSKIFLLKPIGFQEFTWAFSNSIFCEVYQQQGSCGVVGLQEIILQGMVELSRKRDEETQLLSIMD